MELDVHGRQVSAYRIINLLNKKEKDIANIKVIEEKHWAEYF